MRQGIEANNVGGTVGRTLRPADDRAGQRVHYIETQTEAFGVMDNGQDRENTDAVGHEIRRVFGTHDAFAETGDQPRFQVVEQFRRGRLGGDQLDQMHVARRVEEVDAAELRAQRLGQTFGQAVDRQAGSIRGDDGLG